jgi:hypothetical protein
LRRQPKQPRATREEFCGVDIDARELAKRVGAALCP